MRIITIAQILSFLFSFGAVLTVVSGCNPKKNKENEEQVQETAEETAARLQRASDEAAQAAAQKAEAEQAAAAEALKAQANAKATEDAARLAEEEAAKANAEVEKQRAEGKTDEEIKTELDKANEAKRLAAEAKAAAKDAADKAEADKAAVAKAQEEKAAADRAAAEKAEAAKVLAEKVAAEKQAAEEKAAREAEQSQLLNDSQQNLKSLKAVNKLAKKEFSAETGEVEGDNITNRMNAAIVAIDAVNSRYVDNKDKIPKGDTRFSELYKALIRLKSDMSQNVQYRANLMPNIKSSMKLIENALVAAQNSFKVIKDTTNLSLEELKKQSAIISKQLETAKSEKGKFDELITSLNLAISSSQTKVGELNSLLDTLK